MSYIDIMDLSSDDEKIDVKAVKLEPDLVGVTMQQIKGHKAQLAPHQKSKTCVRSQDSEENRSSNGQSSTTVLEPEQSPVNETSLSSPSSICSAPLCRQFWKAGDYEDGLAPKKTSIRNGKNYLHIHPMFLHSNATSHKWAFGAIAELLDNAVDEIQNGATFVNVDKTTNPRDGSAALLIQDDGGGMDPYEMRRCMSFGFSDKKSKSAIGQYGNGFKTSSMRLGADVIVFSRHLNTRTMTQSIGLLSYTFLTRTSHDRIVVPTVQYKFNTASGSLEPLYLYGQDHFTSNLSVLLQWSPYSKEAELLKQFDDIGYHGTKVIVYNLWLSDEKDVELDFDRDPEDICLRGDTKLPKAINEQQIAHRFKFSLRVYLSILYLRLPESFKIILRGRDVEHHCIVNDLKFRELIMYRPQNGGSVEGEIVTTIGFLKEAPRVQFHGFNVYHKNRLILPFWQVVNFSDSRGRGVVGVLETNFIKPTHNKQDFERTSLFQKLEHRLKEMTWEYWDYHCGLIGYQVKKKPKVMVKDSFQSATPLSHGTQPVILNKSYPVIGSTNAAQGLRMKRVELSRSPEPLQVKRQAVVRPTVTEKRKIWTMQTVNAHAANQLKDQETIILMDENRKLHAQCLEHETMEKELNAKVIKLRSELGEVQSEYARLLAETGSLCIVKNENIVRR